MDISTIKTKPIKPGDALLDILDTFLPPIKEREIVVITSKIVSICEGSIVKNDGTVDKQKLIKQEADYFIEDQKNPWNVTLTLTRNTLIPNAGIDESNGNGYFILWPKDTFRTAIKIWKHLKNRFRLRYLGIIISDTQTIMQHWGTRGFSLAWCGIKPLRNYIGTPDIFGRTMHETKASIVDSLAAAAVIVMGEGKEQTPLAIIRNVPFAEFQIHPPNIKDIDSMKISPELDLYAPVLTSAPWMKGGK